LASIQCKKDDVLEQCDSVYFDVYNAQFWIKTGDTIFLQNKRIIFNSDQTIKQFELSQKETGDYPFLEFYGYNSSCCINVRVDVLDTTAKKINFSMPAFPDEIRFELDFI